MPKGIGKSLLLENIELRREKLELLGLFVMAIEALSVIGEDNPKVNSSDFAIDELKKIKKIRERKDTKQ